MLSKFRSVFKSENQRTTLAKGFLRKQEKALKEKVNKCFPQQEKEKQVSGGLQDCKELELASLLEDTTPCRCNTYWKTSLLLRAGFEYYKLLISK